MKGNTGIIFVLAILLFGYAFYLRSHQGYGLLSRRSSPKDFAHTPVKVVKDLTSFTKPENPRTIKGVWQVVEEEISLEMYLYSAYLDERGTIEHTTVRVMAIMNKEPQSLYCILWFSDTDGVYVNAVRSKAGPWYFRHGKKFQGEVLSCGTPKGKPTPLHVSIVKSLDAPPSTSLSVQLPEYSTPMIDIGVCICKPYGEITVFQIIEWIELLKIMGVGEISIYNNTYNAESMTLIEDYVRRKQVVLNSAPDVMDDGGEDTSLLMGAPILNDCMYRNMYRYRSLLSIDFSDIIVPRESNDYFEMLTEIQKKQPSKHPATSYMFRNAFFFLDLPTVPAVEFVLTQKHIYRVSPDAFGQSARSIISPKACVVLNEHMCWKVVPKYNTPGWLVDVKTDIAINHRYENCSLDDVYNEPGLCDNRTLTIYRDESMSSFDEIIVEKMSQVFFRMNMEDIIFGNTMDDTGNIGNMNEGFNAPENDAQGNGKETDAEADDEDDKTIPNTDDEGTLNSRLKKSVSDAAAVEALLESMGSDKEKILAMLQKQSEKKENIGVSKPQKKVISEMKKGVVNSKVDIKKVKEKQ